MNFKILFLFISPIFCGWQPTPEGGKKYIHNSAEFDVDNKRFFDETTYFLDPVNEVDNALSAGQNVIDRNRKWLAKAGSNEEQAEFVTKMINNVFTLVMTPADVDASILEVNVANELEVCHVILAYNSDVPKLYEELKELAYGLSRYYVDRCNFGVLDLGYPSNMATFGHLFDDLPSLLIRKPTAHQMFREPDKNTREVVFNNLASYGYVISYTKMVTNLLEEIQKIDELQNKDTPMLEKAIIGLQNHFFLSKSGARFYCLKQILDLVKKVSAAHEIPEDIHVMDILRNIAYNCPTCSERHNPIVNEMNECRVEASHQQSYEERKVPGVAKGILVNPQPFSYKLKEMLQNWHEAHDVACYNGICQKTKLINAKPKFYDYSNDAEKVYRDEL